MTESQENSELIKNIPLIPLRDLVVFPATLVPFVVGRPSSIKALEKAYEKDKLIFLAAQMDAGIDNPLPRDIYTMGVTARIIRTAKTDERNMKVIVEGLNRARIVEFLSTYPYYQILAKVVKEIEDNSPETQELLKKVLALFEEYLKINQNANLDSIIPALRENSTDRIADIISSHLYLPLEEKQNLLETLNTRERLNRLRFLLQESLVNFIGREPGAGSSRRRGGQKEGGQRTFIPGAQFKKEEQPNEIEELKRKVAEAQMPPDAHEKAMKEIERLETMPPMSAEATVSRNYLDWLISLPWNKKSREKRDLKEAERILNEDHYGLEKVKERILEYLAIRQLVKNPKGVILAFIGPPGVGKTSLGKSIARATGRKFVRLSLGGVRDEAEIRGHRRTYIGAYPGRIIQMIKRAGTKNPVFLLDEVDKMSMDYRGDPAAALMEVLDPEQNKEFLDHYIDTDFDLSQVMFIVTANSIDPIPRALLDRMEVIRLPGYTEDEKVQIARQFLIPKQLKAHGLTSKNLEFTEQSILKIIREYTREAGVRNLEREITSICRKMVKKVVTKGKEYREKLTAKAVENYLGIPKYRRLEIDQQNEIGVSLGMAWTEFGGELLTFEATKIHGKGNLTLTGHLGEIMQESAQAAYSYVRHKLYELNMGKELEKNFDIHIHVPEGATPKEGPSAGITIATAIISLLTGIPVSKKVAMSGEITLRGKVLPVGGIKEKLLAAFREGITEVILPVDNRPDLKDLPKKLKQNLKVHLVENMDQVLKIALTEELVPKAGPSEPEAKEKQPAAGTEATKEPQMTN
ncbi:MAG: endopeptidase La [Candidatus Saccharicenans sp.]|jgi:ATP-dependent Lon protease|nr:endopeptidase La [Candidatus Saccharicenans sp.]MDH7574164.1 endopeptidase La [Candidatus Saccharicenans sp.]